MKFLKSAIFTDDIYEILVEFAFIRGLPGFSITGLASTTIKESENRIKSALSSLNFKFPPTKIIINLSPSDIPKNGSHFDLAIALGIALKDEVIDNDVYIFGELGLDASIKSSANLFSILLFLSTKVKNANVLVPISIAQKASLIPNFKVYGVKNLDEAIKFFNDDDFKESILFKKSHKIFKNSIEINGEKFIINKKFDLDFKDVKGQQRAVEASLIAAAGMHNILFEGSPGCGKSMCAKRIREILPPQSIKEIMMATAYESLNNKEVEFSLIRPFRNPHHTSTKSSIFGGGSQRAKIGEIALANGGELFFDELPHFGKKILESLREPLEDNKILISRVNSKISYETKFIFVAALNPCPCGNLFSNTNPCTCSSLEIKRYKSVISSAILDRIDLYVCMQEVSIDDKAISNSKDMYELVLKAFKMQKQRGQSELNAKLSDEDILRYCILSDDAREIFNKGVNSFKLSQRGINKTLKVARTIADLSESNLIQKDHILKSFSYRIK